LLLLVSLLASGCSSAGDETTPDREQITQPGGEQATQPSQGIQPSGTTQPSVIYVDLELGPGSFDLTNPRAGLADLSSYQQTLNVSFVGTRDGQPHEWSQTQSLLHAEEPWASILTIESGGDVVAADPAVVAETAGILYQSYRDGSCTGEFLDPEDSILAFREPAGLLAGLLGAEESGPDTANDVAALHFTFDERAMAESGRAETEGEVWVAVDGGQVVRYVRTTTADATYFGEGVEGTITWAYDLTGIDGLYEIILPPGCQIDAPSLPDATNLVMLPQWMGFDTSSAVSDVTAFYQQQLPGRGWTLSGEPFIGGSTELTVYAKGSDLLNVVVVANETATRVEILLSTATD
jgi:hypothetical protein